MPQSYSVHYSSKVAGHLQDAIDYYNSLTPGLGEIFLADFEAQITAISINPYTRAIRYDDVRFAIIKRFHYAIHYAIIEASNMIVIYAVYSHYTNPDTHWKKTE